MPRDDASACLPPRRSITDAVVAPHRLSLGLTAVPPGESWLELDAGFGADLREKHRLLRDRRSEVFVELPESRLAQREALGVVVDAATAWFPEHYTLASGTLHVHPIGEAIDLDASEAPALEVAARCVQEDLCIMEKRSEGWCLTAGAVCFPTRWRLAPQLGRPMTAIHDPVPGYREALDHPAKRFFDGMKGSGVYRRSNWSLMDDPALFQPTRRHRERSRDGLDVENAGQEVWLRVEHQTLQRLPRSGAILFGIRVHRTRLDEAARESETARALLGAIETMNPAMQLYKSLAPVRDATVAYLDARLRLPDARG